MIDERMGNTEQNIALRRRLFRYCLRSYILAGQAYRKMRRYLKRSLVYQHWEAMELVADRNAAPEPEPQPAVLVAIVHITPPPGSQTPEERAVRAERLKHTLDGLYSTFASCCLRVVILTQPERHVTADLPAYQRDHIEIDESYAGDPMFIGFEAQRVFADHVESFDWFAFIEDDIVIHDGAFLAKLRRFNQQSRDPLALLLPNRYELWQGSKRYIDLAMDDFLLWNKFSRIEVDGAVLAECTNPHCGMYCLSREQMEVWMSSSRDLKGMDIGFGGPRECAATFCLLECFSLYKPHPKNLSHLEVRHYDMKYSQQNADTNPEFTFSPIGNDRWSAAVENKTPIAAGASRPLERTFAPGVASGELRDK